MKLTKKHKIAIELLIEGELSKDKIAQSVNVSRQTLYKWLEDDDFKAEYDNRLAEVERLIKRRIFNMADKALTRQERILDKSKNDIAAATVAKDVLDRAGYSAEQNIKVDGGGTCVQIINDIPRPEKDE